VSHWPSSKAKKVLAALIRIGWVMQDNSGSSQVTLKRLGYPDFTWAFLSGTEIGPKMLARIAKHTGLTTRDL
jgi:predicted RNA binding protein YcfA (HicA-like mRNA interferase family)